MTEAIELQDIIRISYEAERNPIDDSVYRILDFELDNGTYRWRKYVRNYFGTKWHGPVYLEDEDRAEIRRCLGPVASKLGISLDDIAIEETTPGTLVKKIAVRLGSVKEQGLEVYLTKDGSLLINLKEGKIC